MSTTIEESILNGVALTFPDLSMTDPHASSDEITMSEASGILPPWLRLPMHVEPTTRVESVLLGLINSGREQIHKAGQMAELSEPAFPSVASLLNPDTSNANQLIANGIGNHGKVTMNVPWVPEKIALMYLMCIYVRVSDLQESESYLIQLILTDMKSGSYHPRSIHMSPCPNSYGRPRHNLLLHIPFGSM